MRKTLFVILIFMVSILNKILSGISPSQDFIIHDVYNLFFYIAFNEKKVLMAKEHFIVCHWGRFNIFNLVQQGPCYLLNQERQGYKQPIRLFSQVTEYHKALQSYKYFLINLSHLCNFFQREYIFSIKNIRAMFQSPELSLVRHRYWQCMSPIDMI